MKIVAAAVIHTLRSATGAMQLSTWLPVMAAGRPWLRPRRRTKTLPILSIVTAAPASRAPDDEIAALLVRFAQRCPHLESLPVSSGPKDPRIDPSQLCVR